MRRPTRWSRRCWSRRCWPRAGAWGLLLAALLGAASVPAAPVPEADRLGLDLRRTTLVVDDMERSLAFYRDALGMALIYDNWVLTPREAASPEDADIARRLVFLRANDDYIGVLGLLQYVKPDREPVELTDRAFHPGTTVLVFNVEESRRVFAKASEVEGVRVLSEPSEVTYPSYSGDGVIRVLVSVLQDPDGVAVEINQLLEELH